MNTSVAAPRPGVAVSGDHSVHHAARNVSLRTVHLIDSLGPAGAERSLAELMPPMLRDGMQPTVVCLQGRSDGVKADVERSGVPVKVLGGRTALEQTAALRRLLRDERPALLHTSLFRADVIGRVAAAGSGVPVLSSIVNTTYDPERRRDPRVRPGRLRAAQMIDGVTARHMTSWFHAITYAVRDAAVASLGVPADRVTVVERGRDPGRLGVRAPERRARVRAALGLAEHHEVLLNVGRQEFQKGQRTLLQAANEILAERPQAVLLIAGRPGNATPDLQEVLAGCSERARMRFLGNRDDVPDLLSAADVFVFPSVYEGLGGAVIEAMALELPIVATRLPALEEVVEDQRNAELVTPNSPTLLAAALRRVLADAALRRAYARRSREIFDQRFTLDRSAERMITLFRFVAGSAR